MYYIVSLLASICYFLITYLMYFNILFMLVVLFCMFVFYFVYSVFFLLFCVMFLLLYIAVSFLFLYKVTDHCHWVETYLQLINIISYINWAGMLVSRRSFTCTQLRRE